MEQTILSGFQHWGYLPLFALMVVEGPIASVTGAFLASLGYLSLPIVYGLSVMGDILGDVVLYWLGYWGGRPFLFKAERFLKIKQPIIESLEKRFQKSGAKIIFYVKATTGLCWITFILAGVARMKFFRFLWFSFLGGLSWGTLLVFLGYFFGYATKQIQQYIHYTGLIIFFIAVGILVFIRTLKKRAKQRFLAEAKNNSLKNE